MLYEISNLPDGIYGERRYGNIVRRGVGSDRVFVEAPTPASAFTTFLKAQAQPGTTRTGLIFYSTLKGNIGDYVKPASTGSKPDYVFRGRDGDTAQFSAEAVSASRASWQADLRPVRPVEYGTAENLKRPVSTRPADLDKRVIGAIEAHRREENARGIFTQEDADAAKAERLKAARERPKSGPKTRRDLYPTLDAPKAEPAKPTKPVQGRLFDDRPIEYLGERLDASG